MITIHLIYGTTGEYSCERTWLVCGYESKDLALQHMHHAQQFADQVFASEEFYNLQGDENPFDPKMQMQYTGTKYHYVSVSLREELPK